MSWGDNTKGPWGGNGGNKKGTKKPTDTKTSSTTNKKKEEKVIDIESFFKGATGGGGSNGEFNLNFKAFIGLLIVALIGWSLTGFYKVDASEEGVVLRFGKFHRIAPEGLRFHLPNPIEKVYIVQKTKINSIQVGYRSGGSVNTNPSFGNRIKRTAPTSLSDKSNFKESLMITGDTNIADVSFTVQWRIKDSINYLFKISNPETTVKAVAESAMREIIGRSELENKTL